jgi:hypothetical protein
VSGPSGVDGRIETWFQAERLRVAPEGILLAVAERTRSTGQRAARRGIRRVIRDLAAARPGATLAVELALAVGVLLAAVVFSSPAGPSDGRSGVVGGSPSASAPTVGATGSHSPTPGPAATPTGTRSPAPGAIRIDFQVTGGLIDQMKALILHGTVATPPPQMTASGTFAMSGALVGTGTFVDAITFTPSGVYSVTRTLQTPRGRLVAVATETLLESDTASLILHGTWRLADGTGAWATVAATGTLSGSSLGPSETWIGEVKP